jgi:hypothetical protein
MNKEIKKAINTIKVYLGMETKLEEQMLVDGVTTIQADMFEAGEPVFVVVPDAEPVPLPVGEYELQDGKILVVEVEGMIKEVKEPEVEQPEQEVEVEAEKEPQQTTAKKIVRSTIEEQHFSKVEELEKKIEELSAKIIELSKVEEVIEEQPSDIVEFKEEPKPIQFNPENVSNIEHVDLVPNKSKGVRDSILEQIYNQK